MNHMSDPTTKPDATENRRSFLERLSTFFMAGGLLAGYGTFAAYLLRFLFPGDNHQTGWQYVASLSNVPVGSSMTYTSPAGQRVVISRLGSEGNVNDLIALSSVCPHLGCQVHWEVQNNRFFCPCHNGAFDPQGNPLSGPVKEANQSLARYPLKIEKNLLYIDVNLKPLV